jgi:predicted O-linked N-acetylglucosamine transferase (SPINDLY family)
VRADRIDVLVHLAGRFDRNQPGVAAYRPAPVQVSFHDPATSGVPGMDYLIADPVLAPRGGRERFVERVVRLPSFYVHDAIADAPPIGPSPAGDGGAPTFGIFNNPAKLSDESLALWAEVLQRVPGARLLFRFRNRYESETLCRRVIGRLAEGGIAENRVEIIAAGMPDQPALAVYNRVDIALDPQPFTGSTTTFEALWMGVPVVTLATDTMVGRWSASILKAAGLGDLVAQTTAGYVAAAVRLGADRPRLAGLRQDLRARVAASPLCDGRRRTRQLERLYRALFWHHVRAGPRGSLA